MASTKKSTSSSGKSAGRRAAAAPQAAPAKAAPPSAATTKGRARRSTGSSVQAALARTKAPAAAARTPATPAGRQRLERDSMGEVQVPAERLWGAQTQRALENFRVSGRTMRPRFLAALAALKWAAAGANESLGLLDAQRADAIRAAADEVLAGKHAGEFPLDVFQTGSGTSTNMNMNEVLGNLANLRLGGKPGEKKPVHPNDHVNLGQSSNDAIPTALHVSVAQAVRQRLIPALGALAATFLDKAKAHDAVVKVGRTHLQDATPVTYGQVFRGYAAQSAHTCQRLALAYDGLLEVALGGTAVGTGIGRHADFPERALALLSEKTGLALRPARNYFEQLGGREACVFFAGSLGAAAAALTKIANDVRLLGSGPRCGLGELRLPALQPGSSIMPGKVNPVQSESLIMACLLVQGAVTTVTAAGASGTFELNVTLPLMADVLLDAVEVLAGAVTGFHERCVAGLEVDRVRVAAQVEQSLMLGTALAPLIGYDAAAKLAKEAYEGGRTIRELCLEKKLLPPEQLEAALDLLEMTKPGRGDAAGG